MARYIKCIIVFVLILLISSNAYAIGDGNIDSGGGGMSQGTSQNNKWSVGDEGVRVSVILIRLLWQRLLIIQIRYLKYKCILDG